MVYCDLKSRLIPNELVSFFALIGMLSHVNYIQWEWKSIVFSFLLACFLSFSLYFAGWMGGGDAKIWMALGLWIPWDALLLNFLCTSCIGWILFQITKRKELPYTIAMIIGTFVSFVLYLACGGLIV